MLLFSAKWANYSVVQFFDKDKIICFAFYIFTVSFCINLTYYFLNVKKLEPENRP